MADNGRKRPRSRAVDEPAGARVEDRRRGRGGGQQRGRGGGCVVVICGATLIGKSWLCNPASGHLKYKFLLSTARGRASR
jgi:hypothetical protein